LKTPKPPIFCFDISFDKKLNAYTPTAYIIDYQETITYLDKKASPEVLQDFGISKDNLDPSIKKILSICEALKPSSIFKKFGKNSKSIKTLEKLLEDKKIEFGIRQFLKTNLDVFLNIICENNLPLSLQLDFEKNFQKGRIITGNPNLETKIKFEKNENGILYSLYLKENETLFTPANQQVTLLLDEPSWLVLDQKLFKLQAINSNKIIPFLKKETIAIPSKLIPDYFEKFIKDMVKKVDIEATGFEIIQKTKISSCYLETVHDFFKNKYFINLIFDYDGYRFDNSKTKNTHSEIDLTHLDQIKVIQYKRNSATELDFEKKLIETGFIKTETHFFNQKNQKNSSDTYENIQWVIDNQERLEKLGFEVTNLKIENKKLITQKATIISSNELKNDWFDIQMTVSFGEFSFSFAEIITNIKDKNRLYLLPNGSYFLIPIEWMTTYSTLAKLSKIQNGNLQLPKSNFAVLEAFSDSKINQSDSKEVLYAPSHLLKATLRPYQEEGVKWLLDHYNNRLGACLADDMGLGKTLQTLATLVAVQEKLEIQETENVQLDLFGTAIPTTKEYLKVLIVLPSSLVFNWYNETQKFTPHFRRIQYIGNGRKSLSKKLDKYDIIFTSYTIVSRDILVLEKYNFRYLILDESQYIKNKNSKVFKAISQITAQNKISLSGTPIENSLDDLWSQMQFINPNILGSYAFFAENYKTPIQKNNDENSLQELKKIIQPFILRRTKTQVLKDLPELSEQIFYCDMESEQEKLYEEEKSKARNFLLKTDGSRIDKINIINTLMRLRQLSNHPKMIDATSEIDSGKYIAVTHYLETLVQSNQKTIVFSSFVSNLGFYKNWCLENKIEFCELTGATPAKDREIAVNRFQEQEKPLLFFISLKAGGVGLNITRASYVLFLDPWWNPFAEKQGLGRAHRIGQLNKVNAVRFITKNTVEEKIIRLQENKKLLSDSLLDENYIDSEIETHLNYILE
jgi:SNF2 family DNA or RNA helicase